GLAGPDLPPLPQAPRRLVLLETSGWRKAGPGAQAALEAAASVFRERGVDVVTRRSSQTVERFEHSLGDGLIDWAWAIIGWEFGWPLGGYVQRNPSAVSRSLIGRLADGAMMSQHDYGEALARRNALRTAYAEFMAPFDGAITLSATGAAPVGFGATGHPGF